MLASGSGTNLQAIIDTIHASGEIQVSGVVSNRSDSGALQRARSAGVECASFERSDFDSRAARDHAIAVWLINREVDLVVLAGYMELIDSAFLSRFPNRVINVHPSLLPAFPGAKPIEDQIAYGVKVGGVTVHFVDEGVDTGPVLLQEAVKLPYTRNPEEILELLHKTEHELLPRAILLIAAGAVSFDPDNPRVVRVEEGVLHE